MISFKVIQLCLSIALLFGLNAFAQSETPVPMSSNSESLKSLQSNSKSESAHIKIDTLPAILQLRIHEVFPQYMQRTMTLPEAEEVLKWLHLQVDHDLVQLWQVDDEKFEFRVIKRLRIKEIHYQGFSAISENEASRIIGIKLNEVFESDNLVSAGERLRKAYQDLGYLNCQIDIEYPTRSDGHIQINVKVEENKQTQIKSVIFESSNEPLNKDLQKAVNSFFQEAFKPEALDRITQKAKAFLIENRYSRAEITGPQISFNADETLANLKFKIDKIERYEFQFKGNFYKTNSTLSQTFDLTNFFTANTNIGAELAQKIKTYYLSEGYARIEVQVEQKEDRPHFLKILTFNINEGPRIKIEKIQITGRLSQPEEEYRKILIENASPLIQNGYYSREDIDAAANNLKLELQNRGFLLAKILTIRTPLGKEKDKVPVLLSVDEGPQTNIESIQFSGNTNYNSDNLLKAIDLKNSGPLRLTQVEMALQKLRDFYRGQGYLEMNIENEKSDLVTYSSDNTLAQIQFKIFEGPQVRVAGIALEGNSFTQDKVILNELDFSQGEILTPQKIDDSILRMQRTGYFGSVDIHTLEDKTAVADRTVVIRVTEREPGVFTTGFGVTSERNLTLRGYAGVAYRNLYGTGRGLSFRLEGNYNVAVIKYPEYKATIGYLEPHLLDSRNRGRVNITRARQITDTTARTATDTVQTSFSMERDITPQITGIWETYSLASTRDYGIDGNIPEVLLDIGSTGFSLDIDHRDNPFNPTSGHLTKFNIEYGAPFLLSTPTIEYWRATSSFTHFTPLYKKSVVWSNYFRVGHLQNLSQDPLGGVPFDKKGFILGGRSTLRGFEAGTDDVFPNYHDFGIDSGKTFYMKESAEMALFKSELNFPLYGNFSGAVFYDGGYVYLTEKTFEYNYRDSVGIGFRYNTPVGPLNVDVGWKLNRRDGESASRFHLGFGTF